MQGSPVGAVRARTVETPSLASYCFPALRFGHDVGLCTGDGREPNDAWLSQTADSRLLQNGDLLRQQKNPDRLCMCNTLRVLDFSASLHLTILDQPANFEFFQSDSPCPDRAHWLEAMRGAFESQLQTRK